jgi:hypothetical protein
MDIERVVVEIGTHWGLVPTTSLGRNNPVLCKTPVTTIRTHANLKYVRKRNNTVYVQYQLESYNTHL